MMKPAKDYVSRCHARSEPAKAGALSVGDGAHAANVALLGSYMASSFAMASDGHGGTLITAAAQAPTSDPVVAPPHL
jgi:hypothetical protein